MESQYWPAEHMLAYQRSQLSQLLVHARANVPFYKERLDPVFTGNGEINWSRWHEIPIVKRHHLVDERESMLAAKLPPGHGTTQELFSSGSSGVPIVTSHNGLLGVVSWAALYRGMGWHRMDWSKNVVTWMGNNDLVARWPDGLDNGTLAPPWTPSKLKGTHYVINRSTSAEQVIEFAQRKQAKYLSGRPKSLQSLALTAERLGIKIAFEKLIVYSTGVTDDEREDFLRVFNARVVSFYSSGEGDKMGISCESGNHYHINSELVLMEILDDEGRPCAIGQPGRVVITPIFNTAQPLIRYEQGDIAICGAACACGKTLPVLQEISGRITHLFQFPDGRKIAPSLPDREFNAGFGAKTWQLVQTGDLTVELRYVQQEGDSVVNKSYAEDMIHQRVHKDLLIKFVRLSETPLNSAGKFLQYKSELK